MRRAGQGHRPRHPSSVDGRHGAGAGVGGAAVVRGESAAEDKGVTGDRSPVTHLSGGRMADLAELERRLLALEDIEALKQLKYRYWRHLDLKQWDELARCFADDATVCYSSGKYEFAGVTAIMGFLSTALGRERGSVTIH